MIIRPMRQSPISSFAASFVSKSGSPLSEISVTVFRYLCANVKKALLQIATAPFLYIGLYKLSP